MEMLRELANDANVGGCGTMRVIKSLEFFQHFVAQLGHRDLHFLRPNLSQPATDDIPRTRGSVRRASGFVQIPIALIIGSMSEMACPQQLREQPIFDIQIAADAIGRQNGLASGF